MSLEALDTISVAEEKARQIRAAAGTEAKNILRQAEEAAAAMLADAQSQAEEENREAIRRVDDRARGEAQELAASTRNREAAMKARAENRMDEVVDMLVERIVNG